MSWFFSKREEPQRREEAPASACPVDHSTREAWRSACPVDHETRDAYLKEHGRGGAAPAGGGGASAHLSNERVVSSIPRYYPEGQHPEDKAPASTHAMDDGAERDDRWVYPSPSQFYNAVRRKNHQADAADMDVVVPIHNAVNEEAWRRIVEWEQTWRHGSAGPQLVNFIGRPRERTWRAWGSSLMGYQPPFDRHDWTIVRPSSEPGAEPQRMRYIIDFYAGQASSSAGSAQALANAGKDKGKVSFYLDVRPAPDTIEGIAMRMHRWWMPGGRTN